MTEKKPPLEEILPSDLAERGFLPYAYNVVNLNTIDPSAVWMMLISDPLMAMHVFRDMEEKDDVIASSLDTRKDGVLAKSRHILPASDKRQDRKIATFIEETLEGYFDSAGGVYTGLNQTLYETLEAIGKGVSIGEIIWAEGPDRIYARQVKFKPQHLFAFGGSSFAPYSTASYVLPQTGPLMLRAGFGIQGVSGDGSLPEYKFLVGSYRPQYSNRWGTPLLRKVFWPSWFKRASLKQWLRYLEKGTGSVVARYNDGAQESEQQVALNAARAIQEESAVALPKKFMIEIMDHVRQGGSMGGAFESLVDGVCNNAIMRVILGQTLTSRGSEGGGSRALGEVHQQVRAEKIEGDARFLMEVINIGLVWPLWVIDYEPQRDLSAISTWLARLWTMRVRIPSNYVYTTFQIPEPAEDEDVLAEPASVGNPSLPAEGIDPTADFAEKKTSPSGKPLKKPSTSKIERFSKLRPSTMKSSAA